MTKFVASIEARMGSTRLPGKVLADIGGVPALTRLLRRLRGAERLDGIVLATSTNTADDALAGWAAAEDVACFRGDEDDVLARVLGAQEMMGSDVVVEICGDTPLLDPAVVDMAVEAYAANECDVVTTTQVPSFPLGIDVEVFGVADLAHVAETVDDPHVREHVSPYFYDSPKYRVHHLMAPKAWRRPDLRLVLDEAPDLELIREIYARLEPRHGDSFGTGEIIQLFDAEPGLKAINGALTEAAAP